MWFGKREALFSALRRDPICGPMSTYENLTALGKSRCVGVHEVLPLPDLIAATWG